MDSRLRRRLAGYQTWTVFRGEHFARFGGCVELVVVVAVVVLVVVVVVVALMLMLARVVVAAAAGVEVVVMVHLTQTRTRNRLLWSCDSYSRQELAMF